MKTIETKVVESGVEMFHCDNYNADIDVNTCLARQIQLVDDCGNGCEAGKEIRDRFGVEGVAPEHLQAAMAEKKEKGKPNKRGICSMCGKELTLRIRTDPKLCYNCYDKKNGTSREERRPWGICKDCGKEGKLRSKSSMLCDSCYHRQLYHMNHNGNGKITIDFREHTELLEALQKRAKAQMRPVSFQILYDLLEKMRAEGELK